MLLNAASDYVELTRVLNILLPQIDYPSHLTKLQLLLLSREESDSAAATLLQSAYDATNNPEYGLTLAQILMSQKRYAEANPVLIQMWMQNQEANDLLFYIAANYEAIDSLAQAQTWFEALLAKDPKNHIALNYLGYMLVDAAKSPQAIERGAALIDSALALSPNENAYLDSKAWALYRLGRPAEALPILEKIEQTGFDDQELWEHLAAVCDALGQKERAAKYREKLK
jgi:predicted Zn-dependent protease